MLTRAERERATFPAPTPCAVCGPSCHLDSVRREPPSLITVQTWGGAAGAWGASSVISQQLTFRDPWGATGLRTPAATATLPLTSPLTSGSAFLIQQKWPLPQDNGTNFDFQPWSDARALFLFMFKKTKKEKPEKKEEEG